MRGVRQRIVQRLFSAGANREPAPRSRSDIVEEDMLRVAFALALSGTLAGGPLLLDQCDAACAEARTAAAVAAAGARSSDPTCHRPRTAISSIASVPVPCGHDHAGIDGAAAIGETPQVRALRAPLVAVVAQAPEVIPFSQAAQARDYHPTSPPGTVTPALASPLRI